MSADADPLTGYAIEYGGAWRQFGGTSAAAPTWAALTALADGSSYCSGGHVGFANPILYALPSSDFYDVSQGTNGFDGVAGYAAGPGYDMASGLGAPAGATLVPALCGAAAGTTVPEPTGLRRGVHRLDGHGDDLDHGDEHRDDGDHRSRPDRAAGHHHLRPRRLDPADHLDHLDHSDLDHLDDSDQEIARGGNRPVRGTGTAQRPPRPADQPAAARPRPLRPRAAVRGRRPAAGTQDRWLGNGQRPAAPYGYLRSSITATDTAGNAATSSCGGPLEHRQAAGSARHQHHGRSARGRVRHAGD